jgi:rSAM/selenodomain-associated transferase 1
LFQLITSSVTTPRFPLHIQQASVCNAAEFAHLFEGQPWKNVKIWQDRPLPIRRLSKVIHRILDPARDRVEDRHACALAVMTKAPRAGFVKTRLVPPLTPKQAAQLNKCFLRDTAAAISEAVATDTRGIGVYTPVGAEAAYTDIFPLDFLLIPQRGDNFGDRLLFALEDLFLCGFEAVCLIDSDSPTVPTAVYERAVKLLQQRGDRMVLGPSDDGGYYLIGVKRPIRTLFEGIDWSTALVLHQTLQRASDMRLEVVLLPSNYDVDDRESLERLRRELLGDNASANVAGHTQNFLREL